MFEVVSRVIGDLSGTVSIDLNSLKLDTSRHGDERLISEEVKESEIESVIRNALPKIIEDFANGEIKSGSEILVTQGEINVVGVLIIKKGNDVFRVITVRRKKDFKPKPGTKQYKI